MELYHQGGGIESTAIVVIGMVVAPIPRWINGRVVGVKSALVVPSVCNCGSSWHRLLSPSQTATKTT